VTTARFHDDWIHGAVAGAPCGRLGDPALPW